MDSTKTSKVTTTLGSWIDTEALAEIMDQLQPAERLTPAASDNPDSSKAPDHFAPEVGLEPGDLHRPEFYDASKFPDFTDHSESEPIEKVAPATKGESVVRDRLASLKQRAERSGLIGSSQSVSLVSAKKMTSRNVVEFSPSNEPLSARLCEFIEWAKTVTKAETICLADSHASPMIDNYPVGLPQTAAILANAISFAGETFPLSSTAHISLGRGQVLSVSAVQESDQIYAIAVVAGAPLSDAQSLSLQRGFLTALGPTPPT